MNNYFRLAITIVTWSVLGLSAVSAQTRGPVSPRSYETPTTVAESSGSVGDANDGDSVAAGTTKSRWPLKLGRRLFKKGDSQDSANDPFLSSAVKGAEEQQRLAVELNSQAGQSVKNMWQNAQGGIQNLATIPQAGGVYPWPNPIDSKTGASGAASQNAPSAMAVGGGQATTPATVAGESRSRIVGAVRAANARVVGRLGGQTAPVAEGRAPLAAHDTQSPANFSTGDFAQQAVDTYLQRVAVEGTANGRVFNPLTAVQQDPTTALANANSNVQATVQNGIHTVQQAPQQFAQQYQQQGSAPTPYVVGAQAPPSSSMPPTMQAQPTFSGYPAATVQSQVAAIGQVPSYVQPRTEYVPNISHGANGLADNGVTTTRSPADVANAAPAPTIPGQTGNVAQTAQAIPTSNPAVGATAMAQTGSSSTSMGKFSAGASANARASSFPTSEVQTASAISTPARPSGLNVATVVPQTVSSQPAVSSFQTNSIPVSSMSPPTVSSTSPAPNAGLAGARSGLGNPDENTRVLAIVGDQSILAGDVMSQIGQMLEPYRHEMTDEQYQQQADLLIQKLLPRLVENKLVYIDFLRTVPRDKLPELRAKVFDFFSEKQMPELQKTLGVETPLEIDAKLREMGSSLAKQQQMFLEKFVGRESVRRNVDMTAEITHDELLGYFRAHEDEFSFPTRAKWERLAVDVSQFDSHGAAHNALAAMGNAVRNGEDFSAVAKRGSHGPRADEGGQYDWTTEGSLRKNLVSDLVFSLPPGKLSSIVEAEGSLHIVRVNERRAAGVESFADVQEKISEKIKEQRYSEGAKEYLDRLTKETYVWTVYESPPPGSAPVQVAAPPSSNNWQ